MPETNKTYTLTVNNVEIGIIYSALENYYNKCKDGNYFKRADDTKQLLDKVKDTKRDDNS